jgi:flagellar biosynthesis regulator FlaF
VAVSGSTNLLNDAFINSGALDELLTLSIQMADFDPQGHNSSQERIAALNFLADVWEVKSDKIEENQEVA